MVRVLVIGYAPDAVDFTDPALPPEMDETKVADGIQADLKKMHDRGWKAEHLPIRPDGTLGSEITKRLRDLTFDCIVIGAGVRMTTKNVWAFEQTIDAVRHAAPQTPLAFNSSPDSSGEAASRWLPKDQS